jgi:hypothetical protein
MRISARPNEAWDAARRAGWIVFATHVLATSRKG